MGQRPNDLTPHKSLHHYWGAELRAMRVARGMSLAELGRQLHCDASYLGKKVLGAQGALVRLYTRVEVEASAKTAGDQPGACVAPGGVHVASPIGPLTGEAILKETLDTGGELVVPTRTSDGRVIFVPVPRRHFLQGLGSAVAGMAVKPPPAWVAEARHDATSLRAANDVNPVEYFNQMRKVLIDNDNLFCSRRVIPIVHEQISIMQNIRSTWRGADRRELVRVQAQYAEFCGWLYQDAGEHCIAESLTDRSLGLSYMARDHDLTVFILARKAQLAGDMGLTADAVGAAEEALRTAPSHSRLGALAATFAAHGYALSGDQVATERAYDDAHELLGNIDVDPNSPYGVWPDEPYIAVQRARSLAILGDYHSAALSFQGAIGALPGGYLRDRGVYLARAALAHAGDHEWERAAALGLDALTIGIGTGSGRIRTELGSGSHE